MIALKNASTGPSPVKLPLTVFPPGIRTATLASGARVDDASTSNDSMPNDSGASRISSETIASRSSAVIAFFLSASSLKRWNAVLSAAPSTWKPSCSSSLRRAWRPECLPSTIALVSRPIVVASMISYVVRSFRTPSWWIPASWANAFRPTIALFGCTG